LNPLLKFLVGAVLVPVAFGVLYFGVMTRTVNHATTGLTDSMTQQSAKAVERARPNADEAATKAAEAKRTQLEAEARQSQIDAHAAREEQEASARKEAAWAAYFKPRKVCDNPPDWDTQVECGNAHIRAKKEFEDKWARGEL
jgi:hypothetical protein